MVLGESVRSALIEQVKKIGGKSSGKSNDDPLCVELLLGIPKNNLGTSMLEVWFGVRPRN